LIAIRARSLADGPNPWGRAGTGRFASQMAALVCCNKIKNINIVL
jgi:hypothetical protein